MDVVNMPGRGRPARGGGAASAAAPRPLRGAPLGPGALEGRRALVTGGAGFVGSHVVDLLVECGCDEVVAVDDLVRGRVGNLAGAMASGRVRLVVADARDRALFACLLRGVDTVFHQAAPAGAAETSAADLLERCARAGVRKAVVGSSDPAGGAAGALPAAAEGRDPAGGRAFGKGSPWPPGAAARGLSCVALRYSDVYGPRVDARGGGAGAAPIRWMERLEAGFAPVIPGDGRRTVDMVHVEDVARANVLAALSPASGVLLDVGSGEETSLLDLARLLARVMGRRSVQPESRPGPGPGPAARRRADTRAAREGIGFEAGVPLDEGLEDLVAWWCAERDRARAAPRGAAL